MTTGEAKAAAVSVLMKKELPAQQLPAAGAQGLSATRLFLDAAAASLLTSADEVAT